MVAKILWAEVFKKRTENTEHAREILARTADIMERAKLIVEFPEASCLDDLKYEFQARAIWAIISTTWRISMPFIDGTESFANVFINHLKCSTILAPSDLGPKLHDAKLIRDEAFNAWLKYVTGENSRRSYLDSVELLVFARKCMELWIQKAYVNGDDYSHLLLAFDASTQAGSELYFDVHDTKIAIS